MDYKIFGYDPYLKPFESDMKLRVQLYNKKRSELLNDVHSLTEFANAHEYFGFHKVFLEVQ